MAIFTNKNTFRDASLDTAKYKDNPDWVLRKIVKSKTNIIENFIHPNCLDKYKKWVGNYEDIAEMSQAEKDVIDQAEADAAAQAIEDSKDITKADPMLKALALVVGDIAGKTPTEMKNLIKAKLA